jgi:hypothetical protein
MDHAAPAGVRRPAKIANSNRKGIARVYAPARDPNYWTTTIAFTATIGRKVS